ncbi:MAG: type II toxin-antitoxin system prevent-host-death family antitoxin [Bacillati bacterium ANGP1]|uniref:Antitoxin n=1 Tax=Candidatus Segetimicrobium genomatis TaxID=2569760 RepID=A0A537JP56_9BACT|nr:MAG: type II toxin-antitoxin system prevent-host-death family antitoxin [Terrabacteria group bacterium ANGP1]
MGIVTAKELKNRTGEVLRRVGSGETVTVTVRGVRVAHFVPVSKRARAEPSREARMAMRARIRSIGGKYRGVGTVEAFLAEKLQEIRRER